MPVEDLIRYFNAADRANDSLLYAREGRVQAWHRDLRLHSLFEPIIDLRSQYIVGHRASLRAERENGEPVAPQDAYALCESEPSTIHFDRLCRTLHALNFLAQQRSTGGWLQVPIHPRHLLAVPNQHGLVYESILKRCGLAPDDIALELAAQAIDSEGHFAHALANYRQRGYHLTLCVSERCDLDAAQALNPDYLRMNRHLGFAACQAKRQEITIQLADIDDREALHFALSNGGTLASGSLFGEPATDCKPTHKTAVKPYNSAIANGAHHEHRP